MSLPDVESKYKTSQEERVLQKDSIQYGGLKLDPHGYPLRPQPSEDPLDPLNWKKWYKLSTVLQVSFLAFLGPFSQACINPAYKPLAEFMHISITTASYNTTVAIVLAGITPLILSPISTIYGRRPIYIFVTIIGIASSPVLKALAVSCPIRFLHKRACKIASAGSAISQSYGPLLVARAFTGVGTSAGMGIGASVVSDMYFMHERGKYMGIFVVFLTNGAHVAAIVGGFTAKYVSWRWCYWIPCITLGITWLINLFCLPETLYHREPVTGHSHKHTRSRRDLFTFLHIATSRRLQLWDFTHCFTMLRYPSVTLCGLYYSVAFGLGSVLFAVTGSAAFSSIYHFDTAQVGLAIGLSTFVGTCIGELASGPVSDRILYLSTRKNNGISKAEIRLYATLPGSILLPAGVIIEGVCFQYRTHWIGPVMGIGIAAFGLQIVSTNIYAYLADCYKPQNAEVSTLLNFGRQTFSFTLGFYMLPFAYATTYGVAWAVVAIISTVLYGGIVLLMWKGREWRERLGAPDFHKDL